MRELFLILAIFLAACGGSLAQAQAPTRNAETLAVSGAWLLKVSDALEIGNRGYTENAAALQAATASLRSPADAKAVAAKLKTVVPLLRASLTRSNAALDAIGPAPAEMEEALRQVKMTGAQIVAEAKEQNAALDRLYASVEQLAGALNAGDMRRVGVLAPRLMDGGVAMLDSQALRIRNRQLLIAPSESTHQALGIQRALYIGMSATMRAAIGVKTNRGVKVNVEPIRAGLTTLASDIGRLAMIGRSNLDREEAELARFRAQIERDGSAEDKTILARATATFAAERETFALGDRLSAVTKGRAAMMDQEQLSTVSIKALIAPYEAIETEFADVTRRQAEAMAGR